MLLDCSWRQLSIPRNTRNRRHLKGGHICADSRHSSQLQRCSRGWPWRRQLVRRLPLASAFNPSVHTVTTDMRLTAAHRWVITDRVISTTASSWAWAHGPAGVMATAGEATALAAMVGEAITVESAASPTVEEQATDRLHAAGQQSVKAARIPTPVERVPVHLIAHRAPRLMQHRMRRPRVPQLRMPLPRAEAVANLAKMAATTSNG